MRETHRPLGRGEAKNASPKIARTAYGTVGTSARRASRHRRTHGAEARYDGAVARLLSRLSRALRPEATARRETEALDAVFGPRDASGRPPARPRSPLRTGLGVLGLAVTVYGAASLTGGWLGKPPWWTETEHVPNLAGLEIPAHDVERARYGRDWISGGVLAVGLCLVAVWGLRPIRLVLVPFGLAAAVYAVASLTGGWLGAPPWWERWTPWTQIPGAQVKRDIFTERHRQNGYGDGDFLDDEYLGPVPGREWISGGVTAAGLGLLAWAAWPRKQRDDAPPNG